EAAEEVPLLGLSIGGSVCSLEEVAVMPDLVPRVTDGADDLRPALRGVAGHEEVGPHPLLLEQTQDARHAGPRAVGLVAHDVEPGGGLRMLEQDRALRVDVEGEARGSADARRP